MVFFQLREAKAIGVREALKWLKEMNIDHVHVETNCLQGSKWDPKSIYDFLIINDIKEIARDFSNLCILFAKWSANKTLPTC